MRRDRKREEEILKASRILFSKKGYSETTLQAIAEKVGITKGTIYLYFKNKEDLLASVIEGEIRAVIDDITMLKKIDLPVEERLTRMILKSLDRLSSQKELYRLLDPDVIRMSPSLRAVFRKRLRPCFQKGIAVITETIEDGVKTGVFKSMDPFKTAIILQAMVIGLLKSWALGTKAAPEDRELLKNLILTGILKKSGGS